MNVWQVKKYFEFSILQNVEIFLLKIQSKNIFPNFAKIVLIVQKFCFDFIFSVFFLHLILQLLKWYDFAF